MNDIFVISDLHLGHENILKFEHKGKRLREFDNIQQMHTCIMDNWVSVVREQDKVYVLGDICFRWEYMSLFEKLPGHKRLIMGNHDQFDMKVYLQHFEKVFGARQLNGVWLTHIPIHVDSVSEPRVKLNIHGHLHANKIDHPKYFNASCECVNYTPVSIEKVLSTI